ncbi:MAG: hypothetical protein ACI92G_000453 [Candidatus Pelagisphaera sp.]|jgi:hypothetical protein
MIPRPAILTLTLFFCQAALGSPMTEEALHESIAAYAEVLDQQRGLIIFEYDGIQLVCISDVNADRMRIVSEVMEAQKLPVEQLVVSMTANFHAALDARYAIGNGLLYSAFIHPLSPLTVEQIQSAIRQVATLKQTFGTEYTSGELFFPGGQETEEATPDI